MTTRKLSSASTAADATTFVGIVGEIFYDPSTTVLRISDNITPGGQVIGGLLGSTTSTITTGALDVTKQINQIVGQHYTLADGTEGQLLYLVAGAAFNTQATINIAHARYADTNSGIVEGTNINWLPFTTDVSNAVSTCIVLIFINGCWTLPHSYFA